MNVMRIFGAVAPLLMFTLSARAADWPQYRNDAGRTGFTTEHITEALHLQWTFVPRNPPVPAWPEPVREHNLMDFDYAFQVVAAGGLVFFGSSADCSVRALDEKTGRVVWTFFTDAPVRFAPAVWRDRVLVASDDGCIYCLSAKDGGLLWKQRIGPTGDMIIGNGRMISRWPLRSGLAVADGLVYCSAGMWPLDRTFMCALKVDDGAEAWKIEPDEFGPQGCLALNSRFVYVPAGRAPMWIMDRTGGGAKAISAHGRSDPMARDDMVVTGPQTHGANENLPIAGGPAFGPRAVSAVAWPPGMEKPNKHVANGKTVYAFGAGTNVVYAAGSGRLAAMDKAFQQKWEVDAPAQAFALIVADRTIVVGGDRIVALHSSDDGRVLASLAVDGQARGLAVAGGRLFVSLDTGRILCFGDGADAQPAVVSGPATGAVEVPAVVDTARAIIEDSKLDRGFALVIGDLDLAAELARRSSLKIICLEADAQKIAVARKALDAAGLYGARVTVLQLGNDILQLPEYFANLIVVAGQAGVSPAELYRVLRPCGGSAYRVGEVDADWIAGDGLTSSKVSRTIRKSVRGPLAGAADWTHQFANAGSSAASEDRLVRWPLGILWFGEPGPARMLNRHLRGSAPVTCNGRMCVLGQHSIMAFDAYNGTELWSWQMPSAQRRVVDILGGSMASDRDSVYVSTAGLCLRIAADTGREMDAYRIPVSSARLSLAGPQTIAVGEGNSISVKAADDGIELTLVTKDAKVVNADPEKNPARGDSWELFFDFRPEARRSVIYGPGVCHAIIVPATLEKPVASWKPGPWSPPFTLAADGRPAGNGSLTVVRIAWADIAKACGARPGSFTFGSILNSSEDGKTLTRRTYKHATRSSYRVADFLCTVAVGGESGTTSSPMDVLGPAENMAWGHLSVLDDVILGSVIEQTDTPEALIYGWDLSSEGRDFTGPGVAEVLNSVGAASGTRALFALNKSDGKQRWRYMAKKVIPHTGICVMDNRVFLLDRPPMNLTMTEWKRGEVSTGTASIVVLDLATGRKIREVSDGLADYGGLRGGRGILLASSMNGMTAFDAKDMKLLWTTTNKAPVEPVHHCTAFLRTPVITKDWVYDDPFAYELRTGKQRVVNNQPWIWGNYRGCGTVSASESLLFFRHKNPAILDAAETPALHRFAGIRPGCFINIIAACGLALMPEASSGCGCAFNFQTTMVLSGKVDSSKNTK